MVTSADIKARARALGFERCGVAAPAAYPELERLPAWLRLGCAGTMTYMNRTARRRADARAWLPSARALVVTGTLYNTARPHSIEIRDPERALVSRYAWGLDYHQVVGSRLERLLAWMRDEAGEAFDARLSVDTGPVQERVYARRAGIGWIGKNCCLIDADLGSWLFLGVIACSLPLEPDEPAEDRCGGCARCMEACPTGALIEPGLLDARRCLSYLTIEQKRAIPDEFAGALGGRVFGCDICQEVCPWNAGSPVSGDPAWQPTPALESPRLGDLARMGDEQLGRLAEGTALSRAGVAGLRRNVEAAIAGRAK